MGTRIVDGKTPKGAAGSLARAIKSISRKMYGTAYEPYMRTERTRFSDGRFRTVYLVSWEEGPFEWAIVGLHGGDIWAEELGGYAYSNTNIPTFEFRTVSHAECVNSYTIAFYPDW